MLVVRLEAHRDKTSLDLHAHGGHVERLEQDGGRGGRGVSSGGPAFLYRHRPAVAPQLIFCAFPSSPFEGQARGSNG